MTFFMDLSNMKIEVVVEYLSRARIIDLSKKVTPGKAEGPLDTGKRTYDMKPSPFPPGEIMHNIEMERHISTHLETFLFFGFSAKMGGLESFPIRAVAIEGIE